MTHRHEDVETTMAGRFEGTTTLITGASRGIGLAVARRIVGEGGRVVLTARGQEGLGEAVASLGDAAVGFAGRADDPSHREVVAAHLGRTGVDHLVNNVGINPVYGPVLEISDEAARKILEVNVLGALAWTRLAVAAGLAERSGAIVNIASLAGLGSSPGIALYGVSKAAVLSLTRQLAVELAPRVRVNAVAPAVVKTDFAKALYADDEARAARPYPLQRLGEPEDVAGPVAFLLSADAAWITGQTIVIDGGVSVALPT